MNDIRITLIDATCILIDMNGFRIITNPVLDNAKNVDLILLSHQRHLNNLDIAGMKQAQLPLQIISTKITRKVLPQAVGLDDWENVPVHTDKVTNLTITAIPTQHYPSWLPTFILGKVIGFVIEFDEQDKGVIYITGDTVFFKGIEEVAKRYNINTAVFHLISLQFSYLLGFIRYAMDVDDLIKAVNVLRPCTIIPIHYQGRTHFRENEESLRKALAPHDEINFKTVILKPGVSLQLP